MSLAHRTAMAAFLAFAAFAPASASAGDTVTPVEASSVPEPNDLLLLALGVVGLIVGRQVARKKVDD